MALEGGAAGFPFIDPGSVKKAAIVCHRNADADSYLSAFAVSRLLKPLMPGAEVMIATPGGLTKLTEKLAARFPHPTVESPSEEYDLYVAVDVGDEELLSEWKSKMKSSAGMKVLVDHHPLREHGTYDRVVVDEKATSAAEVVFSLYEARKAETDQQTAQALLEAILFDSSHLAIVSPYGLRAAVKLIDAGADLALARRELRSEPDFGEVMAKLKGAKRLRIYKAGKWVITTSTIGSFHAHLARSLLYLGSDVSVVAGESDGETRVSMRATQRFFEQTGVKLGVEVAEEMAKRLGGHGGGHPTAASFSTAVGEEEALASTFKRVTELVGEAKELD